MSGEFLTQTLAAGQTMPFAKAGKYFEVIADGGSTFNFNFYGPNGAQSANWRNCQAGFYLKDAYSAFDVTNNSAVAQAITLLLMDNGEGGSRRQPGTVDVTNKVGSAVQLQSVGLATTGGFQVGATALLPANNLRGARIRNAYTTATGGTGNAQTTIVAAPSLPASVSPAQSLWLSNAFTPNNTLANDSRMEMNVTIPPGWGIYLCTNHGGATGATAAAMVAFELL